MARCDKWVALKVIEFLVCVACLIAKRISQDDEARLALLLRKLSREWSLLTSVTWDSVGGAFADAIYGGYVIITFGLILARVFHEVPKGRRILEGFYLGIGMIFFIIIGGLELASLDSVPRNLVVNASVLGSLSLLVAALFLVDLMGPRVYTAAHHSQTDVHTVASPKSEKKVSIITPPVTTNGFPDKKSNDTTDYTGKPGKQDIQNGKLNGKPERPKDLDLEKGKITDTLTKKESSLFDTPKHGYTRFDDDKPTPSDELERSKFGSLRNEFETGNYIRLSDPLSELHYEQELTKFNEEYFKKYLDTFEGRLFVKENYLPELQTPVFSKVRTGRLKSLHDDLSPSYEQKRQSKSPSRAKTVSTPTIQQLEDYLKSPIRARRSETPALFPMEPIEEKDKEVTDLEGRASGTPSDRGYVQYAAGKWPDKRDLLTPRHSPT